MGSSKAAWRLTRPSGSGSSAWWTASPHSPAGRFRSPSYLTASSPRRRPPTAVSSPTTWRWSASPSGRQDVGEVEVDRLLELGVGTRAGLAVRTPADELGGVAEAAAFQVVVADLDDPLGPQRHERQRLARVPPAG